MHWGLCVLGAASLLTAGPASAGERVPASERPATWDMSIEQLQELGLGQSRGNPLPPVESPRYLTDPRPTEGGGAAEPWVVFVNFDGEMLSAGMDSAQDNVTSVPLMAGAFAPYGDGDKRAAVMQAVMADWAAYNILVVDQRPASGEYVMNMTGPTNPFGPGVLGIAPLDCLNQDTHSNITYAFHSVDDMFSAPITATTIGQEVAHSFGLEHVDEPNDIMNPYNAGGDPTFIDECISIVPGPGTGIACGEQHEPHCPGGGTSQNAHQELLALFGPAYVDTEAPTVLITSPFDGFAYAEVPASVNVVATATDDTEISALTLRANGNVVETLTEEPWEWTVDNLGEGEWGLEVTAVDTAGNEGVSNLVTITVGVPGGTGGETDGETDSAGADDDGDTGCGCRQSAPGTPLWALMGLMVLGLRRRRAS